MARLWTEVYGAETARHRLDAKTLVAKITKHDRIRDVDEPRVEKVVDERAIAEAAKAAGCNGEKIEAVVRRRIEAKAPDHASAFQLLRGAGAGVRDAVTKQTLQKRLWERVQLKLSMAQVASLFERYDVEGHDYLDLRDLLAKLAPRWQTFAPPAMGHAERAWGAAFPNHDRERPAGCLARNQDAPGARRRSRGAVRPDDDRDDVFDRFVPRHARPETEAYPPWSLDELLALLREKVRGAVARAGRRLVSPLEAFSARADASSPRRPLFEASLSPRASQATSSATRASSSRTRTATTTRPRSRPRTLATRCAATSGSS